MDTFKLQMIAGSVSSLIFAAGMGGMLVKVWRTHDVDSFSVSSLLLNNFGNLVHWVYVLSLPFGPVYFLHGFYTVAMLLMIVWYYLYRQRPELGRRISQEVRRITQTVETPAVRG